jgi:hypothetical protein
VQGTTDLDLHAFENSAEPNSAKHFEIVEILFDLSCFPHRLPHPEPVIAANSCERFVRHKGGTARLVRGENYFRRCPRRSSPYYLSRADARHTWLFARFQMYVVARWSFAFGNSTLGCVSYK